VAIEHLRTANPIFQLAQRRILLFATPPRATHIDLLNGDHAGNPAVNQIMRTHQPHLVCCAGPDRGQGVEIVEGTRVINPGSLAARSYALVNLDTLEVRLEQLRERVPAVAGTFRTIVVALDDSPEAGRALDLAAALAFAYSARLILVHAFEPVSAGHGEPDFERILAARIAQGEQILERAAAEVSVVEPQQDLVEGPAAEAIVRVADVQHADLIVMGSRGMGSIRELLGSVSRRVLQHAACPVLMIHGRPAGEQVSESDLVTTVPAA
jgi:nucleotide-binding universal stress UspA family protein